MISVMVGRSPVNSNGAVPHRYDAWESLSGSTLLEKHIRKRPTLVYLQEV